MIYLFKFFKYFLKFIFIELFLSICRCFYWAFLYIGLFLYYAGYTIWFLKIPKDVLQNYNIYFEKEFNSFYEDTLKKYEKKEEKKTPVFERNANPKDAMGIGNTIKGKLYRQFITLIGLGIILFLTLVLLFVLFFKIMLIIFLSSMGLLFIILIMMAVLD